MQCQLLCQGIQVDPHTSAYTNCLPYVGNIMTCLEEGRQCQVFGLRLNIVNKLDFSGSLTLPAPPSNLRATSITNNSITLMWDALEDKRVKQYEVYYKQLYNNSNSAELFDGNEVR